MRGFIGTSERSQEYRPDWREIQSKIKIQAKAKFAEEKALRIAEKSEFSNRCRTVPRLCRFERSKKSVKSAAGRQAKSPIPKESNEARNGHGPV